MQRLVPGMAGGSGPRACRESIDAGHRMLGNRAFLSWVEGLRQAGRDGAARCFPGQSVERAAPLQLMGKKKKQQGVAEVGAGTGEQAAGAQGGGGTEAEGTAAPGPEAAQPQATAAAPGVEPKPGEVAAGGGKKKKKKSRVQVALNTLRGEGIEAFGGYIEAQIVEAELLHTLVERINRAEDLKSVRAGARAGVEARLRLLGLPLPAQTGSMGRAPEQAVIAPVKSELTLTDRELLEGCIKGDIRKVRRFLRRGNVDINMGREYGTLLCLAAKLGHTAIARALLSVPDINVNLAEQGGCTPLCCAVRAGHAGVVELLLDQDGINANLATVSGLTPLYIATQNGDVEVVRLLLAAPGIKVNPVMPKTNATPLQCAIFLGDKEIAALLLAAPGIDIDGRMPGGASALFIAVQLGFLGIVEELVRHGAAVNPAAPGGTTPLYASISSGNVQAVRILLTARDTRVNQATGDGISPLGFAVARGNKDIVELLLGHGADPNMTGNRGLTPLHVACLYGHAAIVRMLLDDGADADAEARDPDREGPLRTPDSLAELGGHPEVKSILAAHRRRRRAAPPRLERLSPTGEPGNTAPPQAPSSPGAVAHEQEERTSPAPRDSAAGRATANVPPVPPAPSPPGAAAPVRQPPAPLAQAQDALRQEVLGKLRADNLDTLQGIRLLEDINATDSIDTLCGLYNRLAHIERREERARRRKRRRGLLPAPAGAGPAAADPAAAPVFALAGKTGLDADAVEVEIKQHLGRKYHRFVSQAVNDMEFGRGKPTSGYRGLWHVSAGIPGVGSCSVFYYLEGSGEKIRVVGTGRHVGRAAYELDYATAELGEAGRVLRIA